MKARSLCKVLVQLGGLVNAGAGMEIRSKQTKITFPVRDRGNRLSELGRPEVIEKGGVAVMAASGLSHPDWHPTVVAPHTEACLDNKLTHSIKAERGRGAVTEMSGSFRPGIR